MDDVPLHFSDVIEVIQTTDPQYVEAVPGTSQQAAAMYQQPQQPEGPYVVMLEQPAPKALRFRYECEGRSAGSIPGVNSTPENKTFPTIKVIGTQCNAVVVVSCVTKDKPYLPHPHNLVGKDGFKKGVCTLNLNEENMTCSFSNLGIQCVKKKDIEDALKVREEIRVDPFRTGFNHRSQPTSIDLNAVRLAFQVFLEGPEPGKYKIPLQPIVSDPIYDKKAMSDLVICRLSDCSCYAAGGKDMILLCEKVAKEDISVRFYEEKDGQVLWEGLAEFQPTDVHKQVAIGFRTPAYKDLQITTEVCVKVQLRRPSDLAASEPRDFKYLPLDSALNSKKRQSESTKCPPSKRAMPDPSRVVRHNMMATNAALGHPVSQPVPPPIFGIQHLNTIKTEPSDPSYLMTPPTYSPSISPGPSGAVLSRPFTGMSQPPALTPIGLSQPAPAPQEGFSNAPSFIQAPYTQPASSPNPIFPVFSQQGAPNLLSNYQSGSLQFPPRVQNQPNIPPQPDDDDCVLQNLDTRAFQPGTFVFTSEDLNNFHLSNLLDPNTLSENLSGSLRIADPGEQAGADIENMSTENISGIVTDTYDKNFQQSGH